MNILTFTFCSVPEAKGKAVGSDPKGRVHVPPAMAFMGRLCPKMGTFSKISEVEVYEKRDQYVLDFFDGPLIKLSLN